MKPFVDSRESLIGRVKNYEGRHASCWRAAELALNGLARLHCELFHPPTHTSNCKLYIQFTVDAIHSCGFYHRIEILVMQ